MPRTLHITPIKQKHENSCWAACIRMVLSYDGLFVTSDDSLANALNVEVNQCQAIMPLMTWCNIFDSTDDELNVPLFSDITSEIDKGRPIIQGVSKTYVGLGGNSIGGHYILIHGYNQISREIAFIDPADGIQRTCKYDDREIYLPAFELNMFFAMPFYTKHGSPFGQRTG